MADEATKEELKRKPRKARPRLWARMLWSVLVLAVLGLLGWYYLFARFDRGSATRVRVVNDVVTAGGIAYRRRVEVHEDRDSVKTTVTFTDPSGGVGQATFLQPHLTAHSVTSDVWEKLARTLGIHVARTHLVPLMVIPQPMTAGQRWNVAIHVKDQAMWTEGSGKAPPGATVTIDPNMVKRSRGTIYGVPMVWNPHL